MSTPERVPVYPADRKAANLPAPTSRTPAPWTKWLRDSDVSSLWSELNRLVRHHPLVRAAREASVFVDGDRAGAFTDLTQELFLLLLSKARFQHYLESGMGDGQIDAQIFHVELANLLTAKLRKARPESYRLACRISALVRAGDKFRPFDAEGGARHIGAARRLYGLRAWPDGKARRGAEDLRERVRDIPVRRRDRRAVGRTGDAHLIIGNAELERLIVAVLEACDAPVDLRTLRELVLSRLPVLDIRVLPLSDGEGGVRACLDDVRGGGRGAEGVLLQREAGRDASLKVEQLLGGLSRSVRGKPRQYGLMLRVLWHCFLRAENITQSEAAAELGVSDSLVSDYRRRIRSELLALGFSEVEEARRFEAALRERVGRELVESEGLVGAAAHQPRDR